MEADSRLLEEAELIAENARKAKADPRAAEFGRRGGKAAQAKKQSSSLAAERLGRLTGPRL